MFQATVIEKIKTHASCSKLCSENRAVNEIMWENIVEPDRPQITIRRMRIARCIPKATNTHSQYVLLTAFPLQLWLYERTSMLQRTYIARFVRPITETECVYCAVRSAALNIIQVSFRGVSV